MTTYIVLVKIEDADRNDVEGFEDVLFYDTSNFLETSGLKAQVVPTSDFLDMLNNQEINTDDFWVTQIRLQAKVQDDVISCIYCKENPSNHFLCDSCGAGMCDECYETNEHTEHYNKPLEECEVIHEDAIKKVCNSEDPDYICEACMEKALSLKPQDFADKANKILEGTSLMAVIIETSELYGEDDDEVSEDDPFFMQPMYEGYIEDINEEVDNTRTGRYCSLESVSEELESFAKAAKFYHIQNTIQKMVGKRFEDKADLELYLQNEYNIKSLTDVDESGLVKDYAFIGSVFEDIGYIDIYYLKIPYGNETIYITEVSATNE